MKKFLLIMFLFIACPSFAESDYYVPFQEAHVQPNTYQPAYIQPVYRAPQVDYYENWRNQMRQQQQMQEQMLQQQQMQRDNVNYMLNRIKMGY